MRFGVRFGQESECPRFTAWSSVDGLGLKAQAWRYFYKSFFFGLADDAVSLRMFAWGDRSVEWGVLDCRWNDRDTPQSVCVIAVSCECLLAMFGNLEFIFAEKGEADIVAELSNG